MTISFLSEAHGIATTATSTKSVTIPGGTPANAFLLLNYSGSQTQPDSGPKYADGTSAGFTQLDQTAGGTDFATCWWKLATASDAGKVITVAAAANAKTALTLSVHGGLLTSNPIAAHAVLAETASSGTHADPALTLPNGWSGRVIRVLSLKDTSTAPSGVWTPATGSPSPPAVRSTASTGGVSATISVQASGTADVASFTSRSWSVFAADGTTPALSQNAVTFAIAMNAAPTAPAATGQHFYRRVGSTLQPRTLARVSGNAVVIL